MRQVSAFCRDERGSTIVEFGILAPVMGLFLVGAFDIAHSLYARGAIQGIVQKTARDSGLEASANAAAQAAIDDKITRQVKALANNAKITFSRRFYRTFSDAAAAQAENWTDSDADGTCNHGEPYTDENNNGVWDADGGDSGQGGAQDKTVYTVKVSYPHMLPIWKYIGGSDTVDLTATTVLMNQPYTDQGSYTVTTTVRNCA